MQPEYNENAARARTCLSPCSTSPSKGPVWHTREQSESTIEQLAPCYFTDLRTKIMINPTAKPIEMSRSRGSSSECFRIFQHLANLCANRVLVMGELVASLPLRLLPTFFEGAGVRFIECVTERLDSIGHRREVGRLGWFCDQLPNIGGNEVFRATRIGSDHRRLARHTLDEHKPKRLFKGWKATELGNGVDLCQDILASRSQKEGVLQPKLLAQVLELLDLLIGPRADAQSRELGELIFVLSCSSQQGRLTLPLGSFTNESDTLLVFCDIFFRWSCWP